MIYLTDLKAAVERNLDIVDLDKTQLLMLATDLNAMLLREVEASRARQVAVAEEKICEVQHQCKTRCFKWRMVTVTGWIIAIGALLALSLAGL